MKERGREFPLSRRQRLVIGMVVGSLTVWIGVYTVLRVGVARPDPGRDMYLVGYFDFSELSGRWAQYAPRFPAYSIARRTQSYSIVAPDIALPWCTIFHPLQKVDFFMTGRRTFFIDPETDRRNRGAFRIGATAVF